MGLMRGRRHLGPLENVCRGKTDNELGLTEPVWLLLIGTRLHQWRSPHPIAH